MSLSSWWDRAARVTLIGANSEPVNLSVTRSGAGPHLTFLHGYPGSSYDWAAQVNELSSAASILAPDLLGFGASDKPVLHTYSISEQANLVEQLWQLDEVETTTLVVHDYSVSIAQELLCRKLRVDLAAVVFTNGGIYPEHHRPTAGQQLLLSDDGQAVADMLDEAMLAGGLAETFGPDHPARADQLDALCAAMQRDGGFTLAATLLHYVADRRVNATRWTDVLASTAVPLSFVWGLADPVSGAHMLEAVEAALPESQVTALEGVGHWPMLEVPALVTAQLAQMITS